MQYPGNAYPDAVRPVDNEVAGVRKAANIFPKFRPCAPDHWLLGQALHLRSQLIDEAIGVNWLVERDVDVDVGEIFLRQFGENSELQALPALGCSELRAPSPLDTLRRRLIERRRFSLIQLLHAGIDV